MSKLILLLVCLLAAGASLAPAQTALDPSKMHERVIAIVPMVGSGTFNDPIRPMFAPRFNSDAVTDDINLKGREKAFKDFAEQILEYTYTASDDGKYAIVEFVARDRKTFAPLLNSGRSDIRFFVKGKHSKAEIETEVKKIKKDFDASEFSGRAPVQPASGR